MRAALLLAVVALAAAECPAVLQEIDAYCTLFTDSFLHHPLYSWIVPSATRNALLEEAIDTACGRRNFTTAFWSTAFYQIVIGQMVSSLQYNFVHIFTYHPMSLGNDHCCA